MIRELIRKDFIGTLVLEGLRLNSTKYYCFVTFN